MPASMVLTSVSTQGLALGDLLSAPAHIPRLTFPCLRHSLLLLGPDYVPLSPILGLHGRKDGLSCPSPRTFTSFCQLQGPHETLEC